MVSSVASNNKQCDANREDAVDDESFDKLFDQLQIMKGYISLKRFIVIFINISLIRTLKIQ